MRSGEAKAKGGQEVCAQCQATEPAQMFVSVSCYLEWTYQDPSFFSSLVPLLLPLQLLLSYFKPSDFSVEVL